MGHIVMVMIRHKYIFEKSTKTSHLVLKHQVCSDQKKIAKVTLKIKMFSRAQKATKREDMHKEH